MKTSSRTVPLAATVVISVASLVAACSPRLQTRPPETVESGDPARGRIAIATAGCATCHSIPGADGAHSSYAAPPLDRFRQRAFIAGALPNTQENLVRWLLDPDAVEPGTAMPDVGLSEQEARDIAAYLHSLE